MIEYLNSVHSYPADLSNFSANRELPRHRWFEFKEGYSAALVGRACDEQGRKKKLRVLDPFMGSGTALVSAGFLGHSAAGIEINPFLYFAATAKCERAVKNKVDALKVVDDVLSKRPVEVPSPLEGISTFTEQPGVDKWIFNRSVLRGFTALWTGIDRRSALSKPLKLALLSTLMEVSNVRRDGKCVRYAKDWRKLGRTSADVRVTFRRRAAQVIEDLAEEAFERENLLAFQDDCRERLKKFETRSFDLFVTSPPYLNSFDYSDVYRPELFAGEFVSDNAELRKIRMRTLRSHVQIKREYSDAVESSILTPLLDSLPEKLWSKDIPGMIRSYFSDMKVVLEQLYRVIKTGGKGWLVVSTSAYAGVEIPVDLILADVAVKCGWSLKGVYVLRQLRAAGQHWAHLEPGAKPPLRESLLLLEKRP
jgi:DNA modification methylase